LTETLHRELWTSWASLLRSYAAMHGLNSTHHAVVEVSADSILLRVDTRWLRFTSDIMESSEGKLVSFALNEDGTVRLDTVTDEMDLTAEHLARTMLHPS
jgi:phosphoribosyl-dephospho-CoA transferase